MLKELFSIPELSVDNNTLPSKLYIGHNLVFFLVFQRQLPPPHAYILLESVHERFATSDLVVALAQK